MKAFTKTVAVFGSSGISQESEEAKRAYQLGKLLAESSFAVCNGGYMGAMEASSRGAYEAGGNVIGITCEVFSHRSPNPYLTEERREKDLLDRISTLMRLADAYVVLDGSIGTLAELFLAWNVVATGWRKPLLVVGEPMRNMLINLQQFTEIKEKHLVFLQFANNEEEAVEMLKEYYTD